MYASLEQIIKECGALIMQHYHSDLEVRYKSDQSPLTIADKTAHHFLKKALKDIKNIPICSEEEPIEFDIRTDWDEYWLVDPLDGTKEFIHQTNEFCISIAMIKANRPILGVLYAPALNELYYAESGGGLLYKGPEKVITQRPEPLIAISRFHHSALCAEFMKLNHFKHSITIGSALKCARLAIKEIDIYPRFEGSSEWDCAAGDIIIHEAGGTLTDLKTKAKPLYNKPQLRNNFFIATQSNIHYSTLNYPEYSQ